MEEISDKTRLIQFSYLVVAVLSLIGSTVIVYGVLNDDITTIVGGSVAMLASANILLTLVRFTQSE